MEIKSDPYMTANMGDEGDASKMMREINNDKDFIIIALHMNWLTVQQLKRLLK